MRGQPHFQQDLHEECARCGSSEDAYVGIDFLNKKTEVIRLKSETIEMFEFDIDTPKGKKTIAVANPLVPEVNAIKRELEEFRDAILNNTVPVVSEVDSFRAMEVAHQILPHKIRNNTINT